MKGLTYLEFALCEKIHFPCGSDQVSLGFLLFKIESITDINSKMETYLGSCKDDTWSHNLEEFSIPQKHM